MRRVMTFASRAMVSAAAIRVSLCSCRARISPDDWRLIGWGGSSIRAAPAVQPR